jgi:hypothetical protein
MSESPRILGVSFISEDSVCGAIYTPTATGESPSLASRTSAESDQQNIHGLEIYPELTAEQLPSFCTEHQIDEIRVLMSSAQECWVQIPEITGPDLQKDSLYTIALLLDLNRSAVVEQTVHPLGGGSPLSILMRSELLERCRRRLPQSIPHDFFTEAAVIPFASMLGSKKNETGREAQQVVMVVSDRHASAFLVNLDTGKRGEVLGEVRGAVLEDAVRIPFEHLQDLPYLVRNVVEYYPWLPAIAVDSEPGQWPVHVLSPSDLVGILASQSRADLESTFRKVTRRIEL